MGDTADKYERKALLLAIGVFIALIAVDAVIGASAPLWIDAFVFATAAFNIGAFIMRRRGPVRVVVAQTAAKAARATMNR